MKEETYQSSILAPDTINDVEGIADGSPDEVSSAELQAIKRYTEENNHLLSQIEQHTMTMTVIMVISLICSALSVVSALITIFNFSSLG